MANDTVLPKDQAIALLTKLSTDDVFRRLYAAQPGKALQEIGVTASVIAALPASSTAPITNLAHKSVFAAALAQLQLEAVEVCLCQQPPTIRVSVGK